MPLFKNILHILNFNTDLPKHELEKDLTEDGFTHVVNDNGVDRSVSAIAIKIDKNIN